MNALYIYSSMIGLNVFIHYPGQYFKGINPKVSAVKNEQLIIDLKFNVIQDVPGKSCNPDLNGNV